MALIEGYNPGASKQKTAAALTALQPKASNPPKSIASGSSAKTASAVAALKPKVSKPPASIAAPVKKSTSSSSKSSSSSSKSSSARSSSYSAPVSAPAPSARSTGTSSTGQVSALAAQATPVPTDAAFLAKDSTYLAQLAAMNKALADYRSQMGQSENQYNTDYASRVNDLNINRDESLNNQADDFASRGMYTSGVYGHDRSDLLGNFSRRQADMDTARSNYLSGLQSNYANFQGDQGVSMTQAKQDALARRAAQYGLTQV